MTALFMFTAELRWKKCKWKDAANGLSNAVEHNIVKAKKNDVFSAFLDEPDDEQRNAEAPVIDTEICHGQNQFQDELEAYLQTQDPPKQSDILTR